MQNISKGIVTIIILGSISIAEEITSFFMDDEDSTRALRLAKQTKKEVLKNDELKLSGIFFIDEQNWTVWLNGVAYSEYGQHENFSIDEVSENAIIITTAEGNAITLTVE